MTSTSADLMMDLRERMVRIETKLDTNAETNSQNRADLDDHERRIRAVEGSQARQLGILGTVAALFSVAGSVLFDKLI